MPSPSTNVKRLERNIRELEERDALSQSQRLHHKFLSLWKEFAGQDVYLYIVPSGQISRHSVEPKVVCVYDQTAADILAYAEKRGETVRLATPKEIESYHARNEAQRQAARETMIAEASKLSQAHMQAASRIFPHGVPASSVAPPASPAPPVTPEAKEEEEGEVGDQVPVPQLSDLDTSDAILEGLANAGLGTVEAVANASPQDLVKVKGVGKATAADLIARASELLAEVASD